MMLSRSLLSLTPRSLLLRTAVVALVGAFAFAAAATPSHAMRHLRLLRSAPAADSVLTASPAAISLWLSEPTNPAVSKIELKAASGAAVPLAKLTRGEAKDAPLVAAVPAALGNGTYMVSWKTMSKDGHVVNGTFGFTVRTAE